jgi:hypothetical protein
MQQRDEALGELERGRAAIRQQLAELQEEKTKIARVEEDLRARSEREMTRLRRERDTSAKQRDEFRNRLTQLADQQRRLLDDLASETVRPTPSLGFTSAPAAATAVEVEAVPPEESKPASRAEKKLSHEKKLTKPAPAREVPVERESNVIDISEAEVFRGTEAGIPLPRVRPVSIPPPQVRVL